MKSKRLKKELIDEKRVSETEKRGHRRNRQKAAAANAAALAVTAADIDVIAQKTAALLMRGFVQPPPPVMGGVVAAAISTSSARPPKSHSPSASASCTPPYGYLPDRGPVGGSRLSTSPDMGDSIDLNMDPLAVDSPGI